MKEKQLYLYIIILHAFVGIGGMFGGIGIIIDPSGEGYGVSVDLLKNSPFNDFFIPGLFLFFIIGIGDIIVSIFAYKKHKYLVYLSGLMGGVLMTWIVIQCIMIETVAALHVIFFLLGLIEVLLAFILADKNNLFPLNLLKK